MNLIPQVTAAFFAVVVHAVIDVGVLSRTLNFVGHLRRLKKLIGKVAGEVNFVSAFGDSDGACFHGIFICLQCLMIAKHCEQVILDLTVE